MANETCLLNRVVRRSSTRVYRWAVHLLSVRHFIIFTEQCDGRLFICCDSASSAVSTQRFVSSWESWYILRKDRRVETASPFSDTAALWAVHPRTHKPLCGVTPGSPINWKSFLGPKDCYFLQHAGVFSSHLSQNCVKWTCSARAAYYTLKLSRFKLYPSTLD